MILVKYAATWCAPCKALSKTIDTVLPEFPDLNIQNIDIDENPELAAEARVRGVPTLVKLDDSGNEVARKVGGMSVNELREFIGIK
jgi:thioredoxin 1